MAEVESAVIHRTEKDPKIIGAMFSSIAPTYDSLNHWMSLWRDVGWRKRLVRKAALPESGLVLDICTGTGDTALCFLTERKEFRGRVYAIDFSAPMINEARDKIAKLGAPYPRRVDFLMGDALDLNFADEKFDVVSVAFGVRNFADTQQGLKEMHRVLKIGGQANILEFFPGGMTSMWTGWYTFRFAPWLGNIISRSGAYTYLGNSSEEFYTKEEFGELLREVGFCNITWERMTFGIAYIIRAGKE